MKKHKVKLCNDFTCLKILSECYPCVNSHETVVSIKMFIFYIFGEDLSTERIFFHVVFWISSVFSLFLFLFLGADVLQTSNMHVPKVKIT
jgi:hypothetical protein